MDSQKYSEEKSFVPRMTRKIKQMIRKEKANVLKHGKKQQAVNSFKRIQNVYMDDYHNMIIT